MKPREAIRAGADAPPREAFLRAAAFIALGSNLGDPARTVLDAMERLQELSDQPLWRSSLWQSSPVDCPPGSPVFINSVVGLIPPSDETPETLLSRLQSLEKEFGRRPKRVLNEPRPLDLDLIAFGGEVRSGSSLTLPHPRAHLRRFVLEPWAEIARDFVVPTHHRTVSELLGALTSDEAVRKWG